MCDCQADKRATASRAVFALVHSEQYEDAHKLAEQYVTDGIFRERDREYYAQRIEANRTQRGL